MHIFLVAFILIVRYLVGYFECAVEFKMPSFMSEATFLIAVASNYACIIPLDIGL